jgi:hypothetical protein
MTGLRSVIRRTLAATVLSTTALLGLLGGAGSVAAQTQTAVEYYYQVWNFYFITSFPAEIAALDGGAFGGAWKRTGQTFSVWAQPTGGALPNCRFFSTGFAPKSSHFYTPYAAECAGLKAPGSGWQYEAIAFYVQLPDGSGNCPMGTTILYRLYNNGMGGAPNHRFTTDAATFNQMRAAGWIFEGDGRTGASACVPTSSVPPPRTTAEGLWSGSTSTGSNIYSIILDTGVYYVLYTFPGTNNIAGVVQGTGTSNNGSFTSFDARDFYIGYGVYPATIIGSYIPQMTLNGASTEAGISTSFGAIYVPQYDQPVNLVQVAGTYNGSVASSQGWQNVVITLNAAGGFYGISSGCTFTGTATPHGSVNVMDLVVTFNGGLCIFGTSTLLGIAYYDAPTGQLFDAAPNAARTDGFLAVGVKQ